MEKPVSARKSLKDKLWNKYFIAALVCGLLTCTVGKYYEGTMALQIDKLGGAASYTGILLAAFTVCAAVCRLFGGKLADVKSRYLVIQLGCGAYIVGNALMILFPEHFGTMIPARMFQGAGFALCGAGLGVMVTDTSPVSRLGEAMGYNGLAMSLSNVLGPLVGITVFNIYGFATVGVIAMGTVVLSVFVTHFFCRYEYDKNFTVHKVEEVSDAPCQEDTEDCSGVWRFIEQRSLKAAALVFFFFVGASSIFAYIAVHASSAGIKNITVFYILSAAVMVVVRMAAGGIDDKYGPLASVIPGGLLSVAGFVALMFIDRGEWIYYAAGVLYGTGNALIQPSLSAAAMRGIPRHRRGAAFATYGMPIELGIALGSILWGIIADNFGFKAIYFGAAVCVAVMLVISVFFYGKKPQGRPS